MSTTTRRKLPHQMTVDEFIAWAGDGRWQLVDGEPRAMAPAIVPRVRARSKMRAPDLAVTCSQVEAGQIALPDPLLIVEILSPGNESDTWENVWTYVSIPSVQEILILRSATIAADLLRRRADGTWPDDPVHLGQNDALYLESIGLTYPLTELYTGTYLARSV